VKEPDYKSPDNHIVIAGIDDDQVDQKYFKIGYDTHHWAISTPQHYY
jgi:hypothetical protein